MIDRDPDMSEEKCRLCAGDVRPALSAPLLGRDVRYVECIECDYVQTELPYWLEQAYAEPINRYDVGIVLRNRENAARVLMLLFAVGALSGTVVDRAGGYGLLVRMLRDAGVDAYWEDPHAENLFARGFEWHDDVAPGMVTLFEVLEHLVDPVTEFNALAQDAPFVFASTQLAPADAMGVKAWWYRAPEHGQHVGFFRAGSLAMLAERCGYRVALLGDGYQVFSRDPLPARWRLLQRARRVAPLLARVLMKPLTQSDFESLRSS